MTEWRPDNVSAHRLRYGSERQRIFLLGFDYWRLSFQLGINSSNAPPFRHNDRNENAAKHRAHWQNQLESLRTTCQDEIGQTGLHLGDSAEYSKHPMICNNPNNPTESLRAVSKHSWYIICFCSKIQEPYVLLQA